MSLSGHMIRFLSFLYSVAALNEWSQQFMSRIRAREDVVGNVNWFEFVSSSVGQTSYS
jgi:hypothetical protein